MSPGLLVAGNYYTGNANTWILEGFVWFDFPKVDSSEYQEGLFFFTLKEESDCVTCTRLPYQIGRVVDNPTTA